MKRLSITDLNRSLSVRLTSQSNAQNLLFQTRPEPYAGVKIGSQTAPHDCCGRDGFLIGANEVVFLRSTLLTKPTTRLDYTSRLLWNLDFDVMYPEDSCFLAVRFGRRQLAGGGGAILQE